MRRRQLLALLGLGPSANAGATNPPRPQVQTNCAFSCAPIEMVGDWRGLNEKTVAVVLRRVVKSCVLHLNIRSDRSPRHLKIENKLGGPAIWLHEHPKETAWIVVNIAGPYWIQLAYQLGHELGHVLCNSWDAQSRPAPPSQWLEETLAEAFSIRGLGILADDWERDPPFVADSEYSASIRQYRADLIANYMKPAAPNGAPVDWRLWSGLNWKPRGLPSGSHEQKGPVTLSVLEEMEADAAAAEDLGALNRWRDRTRVPATDYLRLWERSCREIGSPGKLPRRLLRLFDL